MARNPARPLSPHLSIWKWGPHMAASIAHRVTGVGLALAGGALVVWGLAAAAAGEAAWGRFTGSLTTDEGMPNLIALVLLIGLSWSFFTHMFNGMRHFVLDSGAGYELRTNKRFALAVLLGGLFATVLLWGWLLWSMWPGGGANG